MYGQSSGKGGNLYDAYDPLNYLMIKPGYPYKGAPFFPDAWDRDQGGRGKESGDSSRDACRIISPGHRDIPDVLPVATDGLVPHRSEAHRRLWSRRERSVDWLWISPPNRLLYRDAPHGKGPAQRVVKTE